MKSALSVGILSTWVRTDFYKSQQTFCLHKAFFTAIDLLINHFLFQNDFVFAYRCYYFVSRFKTTFQQPLPCQPDFREENQSSVCSFKCFMGNRKVTNGHYFIFAQDSYFFHIVVFSTKEEISGRLYHTISFII